MHYHKIQNCTRHPKKHVHDNCQVTAIRQPMNDSQQYPHNYENSSDCPTTFSKAFDKKKKDSPRHRLAEVRPLHAQRLRGTTGNRIPWLTVVTTRTNNHTTCKTSYPNPQSAELHPFNTPLKNRRLNNNLTRPLESE